MSEIIIQPWTIVQVYAKTEPTYNTSTISRLPTNRKIVEDNLRHVPDSAENYYLKLDLDNPVFTMHKTPQARLESIGGYTGIYIEIKRLLMFDDDAEGVNEDGWLDDTITLIPNLLDAFSLSSKAFPIAIEACPYFEFNRPILPLLCEYRGVKPLTNATYEWIYGQFFNL